MSPTQASHRFELFGEHWGGRRERTAGAKWLVGVHSLGDAPPEVTWWYLALLGFCYYLHPDYEQPRSLITGEVYIHAISASNP